MLRRDFVNRLALTAAGLFVADDALEMLVEPRRKLWPGADFGMVLHRRQLKDRVFTLRRSAAGVWDGSWTTDPAKFRQLVDAERARWR